MSNYISGLVLFLIILVSVLPGAQSPHRSVAVTFDDLPVARYGGLAVAQSVTYRLISQIETLGIPAIGFVTESKVDVEGEKGERAALLQKWLDAGLSLGNHTRSHYSLWDTPLARFQSDVEKGEGTTSRLLAEQGETLRYFRHPYLNTGPDTKTKKAFEHYLDKRGYRIAPVTFDNDDYAYALAYDKALEDQNEVLAGQIVADYLKHMTEVVVFYEGLSEQVLGREPVQVLLLHANALNADNLELIIEMLRARGYGFVTLDKALEDPAYQLADEYVGKKGLSWIQRWAITQGKEPGIQPTASEWVREVAWSR